MADLLSSSQSEGDGATKAEISSSRSKGQKKGQKQGQNKVKQGQLGNGQEAVGPRN